MMRKRLIQSFLVLGLGALLYTGCGNSGQVSVDGPDPDAPIEEEEQAPAEDEPEEVPAKEKEEPKAQTEPETDYLKVYEPILSENAKVIREGYDSDKQYKYVSNGVVERAMYGDADTLIKSVGYVLQDFSGDGVPELLIGENVSYEADGSDEQGYILGGYTVKDNELVCFFDGMTRSVYQWMGDAHFYYIGSISATVTLLGQNHLSEDATELIWDDFYFSDDADGQEEVSIYHNTTGAYDTGASEKLDMTEEAFTKIAEDYQSKCKLLTWTPLSSVKVLKDEDAQNETAKTGENTEDPVSGIWLFLNGASLEIDASGFWNLYSDENVWQFGGDWKAEKDGDKTAIKLFSAVGDAGSSQVAQGSVYTDASGYPALDITFEQGLTEFTDHPATLNKKASAAQNGLSVDELSKIAAGLGNVCATACADFDYDGVFEEFVATGQKDEMGGYLLDAVWFVAGDGSTTKVGTDFKGLSMYEAPNYYMDWPEEKKGFFYADCGGFGSGWLTFVYGVKDGKPYELDVSMNIQGFYQDQPGVFTTTTDDFTDYHKYLVTELRYDEGLQEFATGRVTDVDRFGE